MRINRLDNCWHRVCIMECMRYKSWEFLCDAPSPERTNCDQYDKNCMQGRMERQAKLLFNTQIAGEKYDALLDKD
jgi:hypothetical protein